jgi:hypothetical protein
MPSTICSAKFISCAIFLAELHYTLVFAGSRCRGERALPSPLLCRGLSSGRPLLQDALRPLEFGAPCRAQILATTINEVLNHPDTRPDPLGCHVAPRHLPRDLTGGPGECPRWWMGRVRRDPPDPLPSSSSSSSSCTSLPHACHSLARYACSKSSRFPYAASVKRPMASRNDRAGNRIW